MNTAIIILLACGYLLVCVAAVFTGYYFGRKTKEEKSSAGFISKDQFEYHGIPFIADPNVPPGEVRVYKNDKLMDTLKIPVKKKPTQSAVLKFPDPEVARLRREKKFIDEATELATKTIPPKGTIVI